MLLHEQYAPLIVHPKAEKVGAATGAPSQPTVARATRVLSTSTINRPDLAAILMQIFFVIWLMKTGAML